MLRALVQVFGKVMVCKSIEVATRVAKEAGLTCVTMDGDMAHKKGSLSGGYREQGRSRSDLFRAFRAAEDEFDRLNE